MLKEYITTSEAETIRIGESLGKSAEKGDVFAIYGELGSGKTIIAKGIAKGLDISEDVTSPTFMLLEIYYGNIPFYHFDLYRIENDSEFDQLCFEEYWEGNGVSVIEWADRAESRLPDIVIKIAIEYINETKRKITIEYPDNRNLHQH
jgi:tRNA threonylcarbamoyladenosine biosynthesis protein TsaE